MKKVIIPALLLTLISCAENKTAPEHTPKADTVSTNVVKASPTAQSGSTQDSLLQADAVSGATSKSNQVTLNGTLVSSPQDHATVTLSMAGTVKNTSLLPGTYVKNGTVLATLENPEFITLQQTFLDAHAQSEFLEQEYQRQQTLSQGEASSQKKFEQSKADYLSMKSRMDAAAAQLSLLGVSPTLLLNEGIVPYIEIKAPIEGYLANMHMNVGKHFSAGEPLCDIINKSRPMIRLTAYEKDLAKIKVGDKIEFRVNGMGKETFKAVLVSVGQQVDDMNRSLEAYARVTDQHPQFRPGMYVTARIK